MFKKIEEKKLVGYRVICDGDEYAQEIPKAVQTLTNRVDDIKNIIYPVKQLGVFKSGETSEKDDGYWVAFEVSEYTDVPVDMVTLTVEKQQYAVYDYSGPARNIFIEYEKIHKSIEQSGYIRVRNKWTLEIYSTWGDPDQINVQLCDPIKGKINKKAEVN
ncbi:GyrI-like domain-containing protein [Salirhabdus euzebyi]|uniref:GyrI-like domain-containing protein n=1 Tax=Salirhabdus euzebyi TaxID=394506 RepID=UPI001FE94E6B|nr:GyrI-like domain-containing protein [Salirhabdus euzebyi]